MRDRAAVLLLQALEAARLLGEEHRQALESLLLGRQLGFEKLEASLRLVDRRLCGSQLGHDLAELGRQDALLLLRCRDLRLELGDALIDLGLLRLRILARGRGGEHERERQPEDDRNSSSHDHEIRSRVGRPCSFGASTGVVASVRSSDCRAVAASRRSGPTSAR